MQRFLIGVATTAALAGSAVALASSSPPTGIFITTVKGATPAELNGEWALQLDKDGAYKILKHVGNRGNILVAGKAAFSGKSTIIFQKETGAAACLGTQAVGRYGWTLKGKTLTFRRFADTCTGRRTILGGTFTRVR